MSTSRSLSSSQPIGIPSTSTVPVTIISKLYTVSELCLRLKISKATAYRMMAVGQLEYHKVRGSRRVSEQQIEACLCKTRAVAEAGGRE